MTLWYVLVYNLTFDVEYNMPKLFNTEESCLAQARETEVRLTREGNYVIASCVAIKKEVPVDYSN